jgi:hypothetical protein
MAGVIVPGATAGHCLELPIGELASLDIRRPAGKHQVDGLCGLLDRPHLDALGQPHPQLFLDGRLRFLEQPLPEGVVRKAPLYKPALHLGAPAATTSRFSHDLSTPFVSARK